MSLTHYFLSDYVHPFYDDMTNTRGYRQGRQVEGRIPRYASSVRGFIPTDRRINNQPPFNRLDIHHDERAKTVTATFELPGMQKEDVSINIQNNILTVSGETKESTQREEQGYTLRERRYGKFSRSVMLPQGLKVSRFIKSC